VAALQTIDGVGPILALSWGTTCKTHFKFGKSFS
jgi:hypothetical protein